MEALHETFINKDDVINFYPLGLFSDDKRVFVYIFRSNDVFIFSATEPGTDIFVKVLKNRDISKLDLVRGNRESTMAHLKIHYSTGDVLSFSSLEDTNDSWALRFVNKIDELFVQLNSL